MKVTKQFLIELIKKQINEINFPDKEAFNLYKSKHKMRPSTKINIAGKKTTVGKASNQNKTTVKKTSDQNKITSENPFKKTILNILKRTNRKSGISVEGVNNYLNSIDSTERSKLMKHVKEISVKSYKYIDKLMNNEIELSKINNNMHNIIKKNSKLMSNYNKIKNEFGKNKPKIDITQENDANFFKQLNKKYHFINEKQIKKIDSILDNMESTQNEYDKFNKEIYPTEDIENLYGILRLSRYYK